eukprot:Pompholyxophrys_punicea_v1_NODE_8_length_8388_cov_12.748020.p4 type:complete len:159 gc:universal NODE_8_length_8388_cov_12.748020:1948-1472(-)
MLLTSFCRFEAQDEGSSFSAVMKRYIMPFNILMAESTTPNARWSPTLLRLCSCGARSWLIPLSNVLPNSPPLSVFSIPGLLVSLATLCNISSNAFAVSCACFVGCGCAYILRVNTSTTTRIQFCFCPFKRLGCADMSIRSACQRSLGAKAVMCPMIGG